MRCWGGLVAVWALLVGASAEAACPAGSTGQNFTGSSQQCASGQTVSLTSTVCSDKNGNCVSSYDTASDMTVFPCAGCDCTQADSDAANHLIALCGGGSSGSSGGTTGTSTGIPCGGGTCDADYQQCCGGSCVAKDATCCGDGNWCDYHTACTQDGQCCPFDLPVYDRSSGYCCGQTDPNNTSTVCACANACPATQGCCPGGTVCCTNGWCAPSSTGCPTCPANAPVFCPDGTCAPSGSVCCGHGQYCPNGLLCADAGIGVYLCGTGKLSDGGKLPQGTIQPAAPSGAVRSSQHPTGASMPGDAPKTSGSSSGSSSNPLAPPGCSCDVTSHATAPWMVFASSVLVWWLRRRRGSSGL